MLLISVRDNEKSRWKRAAKKQKYKGTWVDGSCSESQSIIQVKACCGGV